MMSSIYLVPLGLLLCSGVRRLTIKRTLSSIAYSESISVINRFAKDDQIKFDRDSHTYTVDGYGRMNYSVTELVSSLFPPFDTDEKIKIMVTGKNWPRPEYMHPNGTAYSVDDIKQKWKSVGQTAAEEGTNMHEMIQQYIEKPDENLIRTTEMRLFKNFYNDQILGKGIKPYRTEWTIAYPKLSLAGSLDFIGLKPDGSYVIMDWKRSKRLVDNDNFKYPKPFVPELQHLKGTDRTKYFLQLNVYRHILQSVYGLDGPITSLVIGSFHPDGAPDYLALDAPILEKEMEIVFQVLKNKSVE